MRDSITDNKKSPKIGDVYKGKVVNIVHFGAFVDFGFEKDGLVHISEISEGRVDNIESVLSKGQEVSVRMVGFNEKGSPKLSIKRALDTYVYQEPPQEGETYKGVVKSIQPWGAFVDFGFERDGMVHISQISEDRVENIESVLSEGETVKVAFVGSDDRGRFQLSIKKAQ
jgi:predicted RNA-binding protein with RPS1 domain